MENIIYQSLDIDTKVFIGFCLCLSILSVFIFYNLTKDK